MNHAHFQGATVFQDPYSMLYSLSAINDELYTHGVIPIITVLSVVEYTLNI
jgi:hypothetical protein